MKLKPWMAAALAVTLAACWCLNRVRRGAENP